MNRSWLEARDRAGAARSELIDAADLLQFGVRWMNEKLGSLPAV
jgi:hypothetical protein